MLPVPLEPRFRWGIIAAGVNEQPHIHPHGGMTWKNAVDEGRVDRVLALATQQFDEGMAQLGEVPPAFASSMAGFAVAVVEPLLQRAQEVSRA